MRARWGVRGAPASTLYYNHSVTTLNPQVLLTPRRAKSAHPGGRRGGGDLEKVAAAEAAHEVVAAVIALVAAAGPHLQEELRHDLDGIEGGDGRLQEVRLAVAVEVGARVGVGDLPWRRGARARVTIGRF